MVIGGISVYWGNVMDEHVRPSLFKSEITRTNKVSVTCDIYFWIADMVCQ